MYALASKPAAATSAADDLGNIFKSTDGGANWFPIGTNSDGSYKAYTNADATRKNLEDMLNGQGWYNQAIAVDPGNPNVVYIAGALITVKSTNGGASFQVLTDGFSSLPLPWVHVDFHSIHIAGNGKLYYGNDGGIYVSGDGGRTFSFALNEGIATHLLYTICTTPADRNRALVGAQDNGARLRDGDTGTYRWLMDGDGFGCNINRSNASWMVASTQNLNLTKSIDGGSTKVSACTGIPECRSASAAPFKTVIAPWDGDPTGNTLYTYSNKVPYRTRNYAGSWSPMGTAGFPADVMLRGIAAAKTGIATPRTDDVLGVIANFGRIYLSTDGGEHWTKTADPPNTGMTLSSLAFDPVDRNIVYVTSIVADASRSHVWRSTDFGQSWAAIDLNGFPTGVPVNAIRVDPMVRTTLYAATYFGAYRSLDSGSTWERLGSFLPLVNVTDIAISPDGNQVRASTFGRGAWELTTTGINAAPVADFNVEKTEYTATFTDASTDSGGTVVRRQWNFGDGVNSLLTNPQHTYAVTGTYTVTLTVTDIAGYTSTKTAQVTVPTAATKSHNDLNGDGRSDLLWFNTGSSSMAYWWMNSTAVLGTGLSQVGSTFRIAGTGDLDGDGRTDIIWRDNATNYHYLWRSRGDGTYDTPFLGAVGTGWAVSRTADINGDGRDDIVWENTTTGQMAYWLMNGATTTGTGVFSVGTAYRIVGAGDFDGDGKGDLLWANASSGYLYLWRSRGDGTFDTPFVAAYGTTWNVAGIADINGDGKSDIVWEEPTQGLMAYWLMNGATTTSTGLRSVGTAYRIATTGDLDGDGKGDIVWANASAGYLYLWRSQGNGNFDTPFLAAYGTTWSLLP